MVDYTRPPKKTPSPAPTGGGVNMSKVTLTKSAPSVSLTKGAGASGKLRVNLNWTQGGRASGGLFKRAVAAGSNIDLDLGALWETSDGQKGVVQALGNSFGNLDYPPYVFLDGDDRSGTNTGGENLYVNLDNLNSIRRILIFAYIYEGVPNWAAADGVVTMHPQGAAPIEVRLDEAAGDKRFCAIAMLTNKSGALDVHREIRYVAGSQADLDRAYGWGMQWRGARK